MKKVFAQENQALAGYEGISSWHFRDQGVLIKELEQWSTAIWDWGMLIEKQNSGVKRQKKMNIERRMTHYL